MQPTHVLDDQNRQLLQRFKAGDATARAEIIELNKEWALELAHTLAPDLSDHTALEAAAIRGIEAAIETPLHSGQRFAPFDTATDGFATWYIRLEVMRYVDGKPKVDTMLPRVVADTSDKNSG